MKRKRDTIILFILKYGIYTILGGLLLMRIFGFSFEELIYNYKANKEMETIHYGGPVSEVNEHIEARNNKVKELADLTYNKAKKLKTIRYYTNDTTIISTALIQANRKHRSTYVNPYQIGRNYITESKETIGHINEFKEKVDSLGYNIFIDRGKGNEFLSNILEKTTSSTVCIKNVNVEDEKYKYKVIQLHYYSDKIKQHLTEKIKNRKATWFAVVGTTPEKEIALLDEIQCSTVIFTEKELQEQHLDFDGIKSFFTPSLDLPTNSTFYFSCYNKKMDELTFLKKVELFKTMFLKKQPDIEGEIRSVKLTVDQN